MCAKAQGLTNTKNGVSSWCRKIMLTESLNQLVDSTEGAAGCRRLSERSQHGFVAVKCARDSTSIWKHVVCLLSWVSLCMGDWYRSGCLLRTGRCAPCYRIFCGFYHLITVRELYPSPNKLILRNIDSATRGEIPCPIYTGIFLLCNGWHWCTGDKWHALLPAGTMRDVT